MPVLDLKMVLKSEKAARKILAVGRLTWGTWKWGREEEGNEERRE